MALALLFVLVGFGLLSQAADQFVVGAARLARLLSVSPVVIGAVVIGIGTSVPEALVSGLAAGRGDADLGVGNVLGSDIANLALVLPVAALVGRVVVRSGTLRREVPVSAASCAVFVVLVWDGLDRLDAVILLVLLVGAVLWIVRRGRQPADLELALEVDEYLATGRRPALREGVRTLLGLVGTILGAQLLVSGAITLADELGVSDGFVGLSLVAIGTSLPELVTAVMAMRRGEDELVVGNVLGSNVFNNLGVGAVIGFVGPGPLADPGVVHGAAVVLAVVVAGSWLAMGRRHELARWEAAALLGTYAVALPLLA